MTDETKIGIGITAIILIFIFLFLILPKYFKESPEEKQAQEEAQQERTLFQSDICIKSGGTVTLFYPNGGIQCSKK